MKHALKITTPSDSELAMTRVFDAPRPLVWRAWTEPALLRRWLGVFNGWTMTRCEIELRVGGRFRYEWRRDTGDEMAMGGEYEEIVEPERIVSSERFDRAWYDGAATGTVTLVEQAAITTLTNTVRYASKEIRDRVLASPMEQGINAGYAALDAILATLA